MKKIIETKHAPAAIGPYSQGISATGEMIVVSGQLPINPETGEFPGDDIVSQTEQSLKNIEAILKEAGAEMRDVIKTTVLLKDIADFAEMNQVYAKYFGQESPARSAFQVAALPKDALIEIEAIAVK